MYIISLGCIIYTYCKLILKSPSGRISKSIVLYCGLPASKKIEWTDPQSPFRVSEIPFPFPFELLPFRLRMVRFRCNSFVETTCIPKRKLQEHITRIPPLRGIPDIGLILKYVLKCVMRLISCVSEVQLKHFQFTLSGSACDQFERLQRKLTRNGSLLQERNLVRLSFTGDRGA